MLAAQRQLYIEAKKWRRWRASAVTAVAVTGACTTILAPGLLRFFGPLGAIAAVGQWLASLIEKQRIKTAATVQEQFDTEVLQLAWNSTLGSKADPEDVAAASSRFQGERSKLSDWYNVPDGLTRPLDVLLCQRTNLRWDAALRRSYAKVIIAGAVGLLLAVVVSSLLRELAGATLALALLSTSPAMLFATDAVLTHRGHAASQLDLKRRVEAAWETALARSSRVRATDLRAIQDGIYRLRSVGSPVPDRFYWRRRDQFEHEAKVASQSMWEEAQRATLKQSSNCVTNGKSQVD
jgi:SMODS-associating 4TM effector domain